MSYAYPTYVDEEDEAPKQIEYAVKNVSLSIESGQFVAIVGHNGSGKSTLAKLLNALLIPTSGDVIVENMNTKDEKKQLDIRKNVGMVFQNPDNQMVASIIEDDIAFGPENIGIPRDEIGRRITFALDSVGMQEFRHKTPTKLSGGQKQRIAIAGMLALTPNVLVMDESTAMLDPSGRQEVLEVVQNLNKDLEMTVILITHFMDEIICADNVFVMKDGEIVMQGTPVEIFSKEAELQDAGIELPRQIKLRNLLKQSGLDLGDETLSVEEVIEKLCQLL